MNFYDKLADERGDTEWFMVMVLAIIGLAVYGGFRLFVESDFYVGAGSSHAKTVEADGQNYIACRGLAISHESGGIFSGADTFKVVFVDQSGSTYELRGIHKIMTSEIPSLIDAPMPSNPSLLDRNGKPLIEGTSYTWPDGSRAVYRKGQLQPVKIANDICPN